MSEEHNDFSTDIIVSTTPQTVFQAVTDVRGWWSQTIVGKTVAEGDEFEFEVSGVHYSKQRLIEVVPNRRVVWLITEARMTFIEDQNEWQGTQVIFDIQPLGNQTKLTFTHQGLTPAIACYGACAPAWTEYIQHSLKQLIETGIGDPNLEGRKIATIS